MTEMKEVHVLCSVPLSDDGIQLRKLVKGTSDEVPAHLFAGLKAAGFVCEPDHAPTFSGAAGPEPAAKPSRRTRKEK
ncbi:hypothetical protein K9U40_09400 [Xanthobacter autotrophicus]|uniref:hypothetical protein n=1 Tax=Xanthobacter TaxID=279 RepID=UPI0024ABA964|nr:hypothetical protein [Xanthobacter autotrophicus]MDI4664539.1 hypothetical protein [Xanthobacter autotrophicus]